MMENNQPHNQKLTDYAHNLLEENNYDIRLKKQFIYDERETLIDNSEYLDVAADEKIKNLKGLYHRYPTKILISPSENCLGHCRFCFRKFTRQSKIISDQEFEDILKYLNKNTQINEVIFSGGDPFTIPLERLLFMIRKIYDIPTIEIIRIHTRVLTYNPLLITDKLINELKKFQPIFMVFHINSHLEITDIAEEKVTKLVDNGILCFSQTALLHEINDSYTDLSKLFVKLIKNRIKPYYLFHPDKVQGSSHFYLPLSKGIQLYRSLYNYISGLAMPIYLFNIPGGFGHCIIDLGYFTEQKGNLFTINTWDNEEIIYEDLMLNELNDTNKKKIVPENFNVSLSYNIKHFNLTFLNPGNVKEDFETIISNIDNLKNVFGPYNNWPWDDFTIDENYRDLEWHQNEFLNKTSFAYSIRDTLTKDYLGCVYIYPSFDLKFDVNVIFWMKRTKRYKKVYDLLYESIRQWISEEWPFEKVAYPGPDIEWDKLDYSDIEKFKEYYIRNRE